MAGIAAPMKTPPSDVVISAYLRHRAGELLGRTGQPQEYASQMALAKALGVSKGWVTTLLAGGNAGQKTKDGMRRVLGMTWDQIEEAAVAHARDNPPPETHVERPERYRNRAIAADFARASGVPDEAVRAVEGFDLKSDDDPTPEEWFLMMKSEAATARFGRAPTGRVVDPDETRPNLPKRRK